MSKKTIVDHLFQGMYFATDFIINNAAGSYLFTTEGRKILDFTSGFAVTNLGHNHPKVVKAIQKQAGEIIHCQSSMVQAKPLLELAERLVGTEGVLGKNFDRVNFWNSGAEAVEASMKLAKHATKRQNFIAFHGGYHGRTFGTMGLTTSKNTIKMGLAPFLGGIHIAPNPYQNEEYALEQLEMMLKTIVPAEEVAGMIIEPVQGENGYVPMPKAFLQHLRDVCTKNGIMLIFDEIQCGMGRSSTKAGPLESNLMVYQQHNIVPDILIMAKGIANGMPLSLIASRSEFTKHQQPGAMGGTYSGNALSCAAGVAVIDAFKEENVLANAVARAAELQSFLSLLDRDRYQIKDIRGLGMMQGIEFEGAGVAGKIVSESLKRDLFLSSAGAKEVIRFMPPLNLSAAEMQMACARFADSLDTVFPVKAKQQQQVGESVKVQGPHQWVVIVDDDGTHGDVRHVHSQQ